MLSILAAALLAGSSADPAAAKAADPAAEEMICKSRPVVGSRIKKVKDCRTAREWELGRSDQEQLRRDLGNAARPIPQ